MNRRIRKQSEIRESPSFLRYLKPGALAQLRDSRISARSHRLVFQTSFPTPTVTAQISSVLRSPDDANQGQIGEQVNGPPSSPCFTGRFYGPRCLQRKKLLAAKGLYFSVMNSVGSGPGAEADPVVDIFGGSDSNSHSNILVAH